MRVLIVDDQETSRLRLKALLEGHGHAVREAGYVAQALAMARQARPDLLISGLRMQAMDGVMLLRECKADASLRQLPFIVYTVGSSDTQADRLALGLGADAVLNKSTQPARFMQALDAVMAKTAAARAELPAAPRLDAPGGHPAQSDLPLRHREARTSQRAHQDLRREQALRSLADSEAQWRALFENSPDMMMVCLSNGAVLAANAAACSALGLSEAEMRALGRNGLVDYSDARWQMMLEARGQGRPVRSDLMMIRSDGSRFLADVTVSRYGDSLGRERVSIIARDISESKRTENELRSSLARLADLRAALDAHALLSMTDAGGTITFVNDLYCQVSGYSPDELIGQNHRLVASGLHPTEFNLQLWHTIARGGTWKGEICNRRKDGTLYWVDVTIYPFLDDQGKPWQYAEISTDITERKRAELARSEAETQLRQAQKMDAIGVLAGGIAHGLNNVLGAILGHLSMAEEDADRGLPVKENLTQIRSAAQRARALVQGILTFSRQQPTTLVVQPLLPLVEEALGLLRGTLPAGVRLQADLPSDLVLVQGDGAQLGQVLLNLVTNAWHALPNEQGQVEVGLRVVSAPEQMDLPNGLKPGRYAHLWVRDDGMGMDELTRSRVFDPFFTTKPVGKGTGLGLPTVYGIVQEHHGAVSIDSAPHRGCTVHVMLPLVEPVVAVADAPMRPHAMGIGGTNQRVLFIDDDETMTLLVERLLRRAGYVPTVSSDPEAVLALFKTSPEAFDLVVTDYNMPRTSGLDLVRSLATLAPAVPVILTSGYIDSALQQACKQAGVRRLVHKERLAEDLITAAQRVLSSPGCAALDSTFGELPG